MYKKLVSRARTAGIPLAAFFALPLAQSQAVDIEPASMSAGAPLSLVVRVRPDGTQTAPLPAHCLEAEIVTDGLLLPAADIRILTQRDATAGWTRVRLSHPHRPRGGQATVNLILKCGSTFERQFTVLTNAGARGGSGWSSEGAPVQRSLDDGRRRAMLRPGTETRTSNTALPAPEPTGMESLSKPTLQAPEDHAAVTPVENPERSIGTALQAAGDAGSRPAPDSTQAVRIDPTADPQKLHADLMRLQAEYQRALSQVATLKSRLTREELSPSRTSWAVLLGLLALSLLQFNRWFGDRRPAPRAAARGHTALKAAQPMASSNPEGHPAPPQATDKRSEENRTRRVTPEAQGTASRWHDADFGRATLSDDGVLAMLREVEQLVEQGYPAAATLTLEQHLMSQDGKHPAVLLSLFDLYDDMGQPWNRERVGAQLEALYNVQGPLSGEAPPVGTQAGAALEDCRASLDRITRTWGGSESRSALGSLLLHPAAVEPLPLPAFREAVWLHGLRTELDRPVKPTVDAAELTLEPMATI